MANKYKMLMSKIVLLIKLTIISNFFIIGSFFHTIHAQNNISYEIEDGRITYSNVYNMNGDSAKEIKDLFEAYFEEKSNLPDDASEAEETLGIYKYETNEIDGNYEIKARAESFEVYKNYPRRGRLIISGLLGKGAQRDKNWNTLYWWVYHSITVYIKDNRFRVVMDGFTYTIHNEDYEDLTENWDYEDRFLKTLLNGEDSDVVDVATQIIDYKFSDIYNRVVLGFGGNNNNTGDFDF
jgi:hypothetical protein